MCKQYRVQKKGKQDPLNIVLKLACSLGKTARMSQIFFFIISQNIWCKMYNQEIKKYQNICILSYNTSIILLTIWKNKYVKKYIF